MTRGGTLSRGGTTVDPSFRRRAMASLIQVFERLLAADGCAALTAADRDVLRRHADALLGNLAACMRAVPEVVWQLYIVRPRGDLEEAFAFLGRDSWLSRLSAEIRKRNA
jgi:hypothetical protein